MTGERPNDFVVGESARAYAAGSVGHDKTALTPLSTMALAPCVLVTSTTEVVGGWSRVSVNEAYTDALVAVGLIPLILPPVSQGVATAALGDVAGLVLTGGEDIDPRHYHETPDPASGPPYVARDACEIALARAASERRVPTLAIAAAHTSSTSR
jgi:gamma-glutamyl-gamma-aminobutyrate hydrolase PuuD